MKITSREKAGGVSPFLAWGDFHARSRFARSTIPVEKWGTTRSLGHYDILAKIRIRVKAAVAFSGQNNAASLTAHYLVLRKSRSRSHPCLRI